MGFLHKHLQTHSRVPLLQVPVWQWSERCLSIPQNTRLDFPDTCLTLANQTERTNSSWGVEKAAWKGQQLYFKTKKKNQYEIITAIIII